MPIARPTAPTCLFLDVDGSIIDIAARPDDVVVPPRLVEDLDRAGQALQGALALVSGRSIAQLDALFAPRLFRASGVHGAEMRFAPDQSVVRPHAAAIDRAVWTDLSALLRRYPGTIAEDKAYSFAVHYRAVPGVRTALAAELEVLVERHAAAGLRLMPGHFVIELKPATFDKGAAVRRFLREPTFAGRQPIFIGDDVTDRPAFAAALEAGGFAYGVGEDIPGTTGTFADPSAVRRWVAEIAATENVHA